MNRVWLGAVLGVTVGVADVLLMLPLQFQDRTAALLGAFCARFALGFFAATARLPLPPIWAGIVVGLLTSMPDAIITKTYADSRHGGTFRCGLWLGSRTVGCPDCMMTSQK